MTQQNKTNGWMDSTKKVMKSINLDEETLKCTKYQLKSKTKAKVRENLKSRLEETALNKSKVTHLKALNPQWKPGERQTYLNKLTRNEASLIFKARTRMLDIKNNFRGKYNDTVCRGCQQAVETQEHVLTECQILTNKGTRTVRVDETNYSNTDQLKAMAKKIQQILDALN